MTKDYDAIAQAMIDGTVKLTECPHRDHVGTAFAMLHRHGVLDGMALYTKALKGWAERLGIDKFHATITYGFLSLIAVRMDGKNYPDAESFMADNPDLLDSAIIRTLFPPEILASDLAKRVPLASPVLVQQAAAA